MQGFTGDRARLLGAINRPFVLAAQNPPNGPLHDPRNGNDVMIVWRRRTPPITGSICRFATSPAASIC